MGKDFWGIALTGPFYAIPAVHDIFNPKKDANQPPTPAVTPAAPKPEDSLAAAQAAADQKRKAILGTGGQTQLTTAGNSYVQSSQVQLKTVLGG